MKPREIRAEIIRKGLSLTRIAAEANCTLPQISMCISGSRIYPHIRQVIAKKLGRKVGEVFAKHHPQPKSSRWCKAA